MLYTGKGDKGTTKVLDSKTRFSKASNMAEALGSLDETNSFVGLCLVAAKAAKLDGLRVGRQRVPIERMLREVQENLFIVQAEVAGAKRPLTKAKITRAEKLVTSIEREIPPIRSFTIAGATELSALLDIARTMARRSERRVVLLVDNNERVLSKNTLAYLNRLSSLLFALARFAAHRAGEREASPSYR